MIFSMDLHIRYGVLLFPKSSTDSIAIIFVYGKIIFFIVPIMVLTDIFWHWIKRTRAK